VILAETSFLHSLAGNDSNSPAAVARAETMGGPIVITALNRLEFENSIALLRFRGAMPEVEASAAMAALAADEEAGASRRPCATGGMWWPGRCGSAGHARRMKDIGCLDPGAPMDFHAYCEVYLGQEWFTIDPRFNVPRIGRVKVSHGADAVDGAFATIYGEARLVHFEVWSYQVDPRQVSVGDPTDLSKRLDGSLTVQSTAGSGQ
jgi:hypothetical protein